MNPYEEGAQAARNGLNISDCPYIYSKIAPVGGIEQYLADGMDEKRNAWARGWHSVKTGRMSGESPIDPTPASKPPPFDP